jgi:hypothetical protein
MFGDSTATAAAVAAFSTFRILCHAQSSRNIKLVIMSLQSFRLNCVKGGARGSAVLKALRYTLEGSGFDIRGSDFFFFNLPNPSGRTRPWGLFSF